MNDLITYDLIEMLSVVTGSLIFLLGTFWLIYKAYVLRLKSKSVDADELKTLKARVSELESQLAGKKVPQRLSVLEEIVTSEEFDLKRKLKDIEKVA